MSPRQPIWFLVVCALVSCARTAAIEDTSRPAVPDTIQVARPGAPWPRSSASCEIPKEAQSDPCEAAIDITRSRDGHDPIARLDRRLLSEVRWSELPVLGAERKSKVSVRAEGIRIGGWASLADQRFELRNRVEIAPNHVWIPPGGLVSVLGTSGDRVVVAIATSFRAPKLIETMVPCNLFGRARRTPRLAAGPPYALATSDRIALRGTPNGPVVFVFAPHAASPFVWLARHEGSAHIAGGQPPWQTALNGTSLVFNGWVDADEVQRVTEVEENQDSGCHPVDLIDQCPLSRVARNAPLYVGIRPRGEPIGTVEQGMALVLGERRDGFVSLTTHNRVIIPSAGQRFWIRAGDVDHECRPSHDEDGCPRCP